MDLADVGLLQVLRMNHLISSDQIKLHIHC